MRSNETTLQEHLRGRRIDHSTPQPKRRRALYEMVNARTQGLLIRNIQLAETLLKIQSTSCNMYLASTVFLTVSSLNQIYIQNYFKLYSENTT